MISKYWLVVKSRDGRIIRSDSWGVMSESGQEEADCIALECMGRRLIDEARALRKLRALEEKAA